MKFQTDIHNPKILELSLEKWTREEAIDESIDLLEHAFCNKKKKKKRNMILV